MIRTPLYAYIIAALLPALARAQTPATTRPVHALVIPAGFKMIDVANRHVLIEPADEPWARTAMETLAPATRPTTAPSDLVDKLTAVRAEVTKQMVADLALPDATKVDPFFDKTIATAAAYRDARVPVYYLATTRAKLLKLVKDGWEDPRYAYNRTADEVMVNTGMILPDGTGPVDDMVLPALFLDDAKPDARAGILVRIVQQTERMTLDEIARRAQVGMQVAFITFAVDEVFRPMKLKPGQDWFGVGAAGVLSARYAAKAAGASDTWILDQMTREMRTPFKANTIDLLKPLDLNVLRNEAVPYYLDAVRRKSTAAIRKLVEKAGTEGVAKVITAMRNQLPPDGPGLVALIQRETHVDLTPDVTAAAK